MQCPRCQRENRSGAKFCDECGVPLQHSSGGIQASRSYTDLEHSLTEALEQQTATAEVLRVISSSPTDLQPVFDAIARSAAVLCGCSTATVFRLEGGVIDLVAHHGGTRECLALVRNLSPADARERPAGWVALERATLHFADIENDPRATPELRAAAPALGFPRGLMGPGHPR